MDRPDTEPRPRTLDLQDYLRIVRSYWLGAFLIVLLGVTAGAGWTLTQTRVYESSASGVVQVAAGGDANLAFAADQLAKSQAQSYVELGGSLAVAESAAAALGGAASPASLLGRVTTSLPEDTAIITVTSRGSTPADAAALTDAWLAAMGEQIAAMQEESTDTGGSATSFVALSSASVPTSPASPNVEVALLLGGLSGLMLAGVYLLVRNTLDRRIRSAAEVESRFGVGVIGTIPQNDALAEHGGLVAALPNATADDRHVNFAMSEALRELRTNLAYVKVDAQPRVIVMTSPQPGDGKSTLAANLAESLAVSSDQRVVVIDCDLRRPTLSKVLGVSEGAGLTDVLSGRAQLHQVMQQTEAASNLWVVGAGRIPPNPSELLGSQTFQDLVSTLAEHATVILDAPPVLAVTDAVVLAAKADGVLMTASAARTTFDQLDRALQLVTRGGGDVLGVVLNRVPTKGRDAREYGYFGGSYYYYEGDVGTGGAVGAGAGSGTAPASREAVTAPAPVVAPTPPAAPTPAPVPAPAGAAAAAAAAAAPGGEPAPARVPASPASPAAPTSPAVPASPVEAPGGALTRREIRERERTR
ncbi:hypothetical protein ASF82_10815 [Frigoribacterium sp. Leaf164]|uniref:polysaccharide biosynthesis tyrosine autokinase n=1 Tax=Frigoribacterium sp. Leaf164 TaxID=1736282 RepID=UPI0006F60260|nr:polysaccharide biosynthesis tyrosine autokinase [Frigoribacterium sp. Leaf164]KQR44029.1 hypothetical protein ASF82_10815 [Frigoribacterium sp. Leaf164]